MLSGPFFYGRKASDARPEGIRSELSIGENYRKVYKSLLMVASKRHAAVEVEQRSVEGKDRRAGLMSTPKGELSTYYQRFIASGCYKTHLRG